MFPRAAVRVSATSASHVDENTNKETSGTQNLLSLVLSGGVPPLHYKCLYGEMNTEILKYVLELPSLFYMCSLNIGAHFKTSHSSKLNAQCNSTQQ